MGGEIRTPHLDALARSGLLLTNFLVSPACSPTRAMLLTGVDTHPAGLGTMEGAADTNQKGHPSYEGELSDRVLPITTLLRAAGYHTYVAGKWHLGKDEAHLPPHKGFERSFVLLPGAASHFADAAGATETSDAGRSTGRTAARWRRPRASTRPRYYTDKLIEQIRSGLADGRPFFAYAAYTSPHWPLQVPDAELDRYRGAYDEGYDTLRGAPLRSRASARDRAGERPHARADSVRASVGGALARRQAARGAPDGALRCDGREPRPPRRAPAGVLEAERPLRRHAHPLLLRQRRRGQPDRSAGDERRVARAPLRQRPREPRPRQLVHLARPGLGAGGDAVPPVEGLPHRGRRARAGDRALWLTRTSRPRR